MTTMSPVEAAIPARTAAPLPRLRSWRMSFTPSIASTIAAVSSLEPSSTTRISRRRSSASTRRRTISIVAPSSYDGMTTDTRRRSSGSGRFEGVCSIARGCDGNAPPMTGRFSFPREQLRARTVRGAVVTGAFLIAIDALVVAQGLIVTRLLGPELIGLYGIVTVTTMTVIALKRVGIDEAYVQQDEAGPDEEEFQRAFTLELVT